MRVFPSDQWLATTGGRIAPDPYSWMQAVHWVDGSGRYAPSREHGPKWGPTTLLVAQEISALAECRPGIDYLERKLDLSERTVQYHLDMLREAGLLVYRSKGTRLSGGVKLTSVYERVVPAAFDEALGIRTVGEGVERRPCGMLEKGRELIGKLAKKAARKVRRRGRRGVSARRSRCTPMEVGGSASSTAASTHSPSEAQLAGGSESAPSEKESDRGPKKINKVGRRYQLAHELVANVEWLARASVARIAWIARHCADAGWQWREVQAAAELGGPIDPADARRPSGLLAHRIKGVHLVFTSPEGRRVILGDWEDSRAQERFRRAGYDQPAPVDDSPTALAARATIAAVFQPEESADGVGIAEGAIDITALSPTEVLDHRANAAADPTLVSVMLDYLGEADTRRLLTHRVVDQALVLLRLMPREAAF